MRDQEELRLQRFQRNRDSLMKLQEERSAQMHQKEIEKQEEKEKTEKNFHYEIEKKKKEIKMFYT